MKSKSSVSSLFKWATEEYGGTDLEIWGSGATPEMRGTASQRADLNLIQRGVHRVNFYQSDLVLHLLHEHLKNSEEFLLFDSTKFVEPPTQATP